MFVCIYMLAKGRKKSLSKAQIYIKMHLNKEIPFALSSDKDLGLYLLARKELICFFSWIQWNMSSSAGGLINRDFLLVNSEGKVCVLCFVFICLFFFWSKKCKSHLFTRSFHRRQQNMSFYLLLKWGDWWRIHSLQSSGEGYMPDYKGTVNPAGGCIQST